MDALTVSQLAKQAGVNAQTIRYYEREGLLPKPPRTAGGYRAFPPDSARRVRFIKRAQELGFTLDEARELLVLREHPEMACPEMLRRAQRKLTDIAEKLRALQAIQRELARLAKALAASVCCIGPPVLVALGVGGAWASSLRVLEPYRPTLIVVALAFLGFAFYRVYQGPAAVACNLNGTCAIPRATRVNRIALWIITPVILALLAFPYIAPHLFAQTSTKGVSGMKTNQVVLKVNGMTCGSCTATVRQSLTQVEGVQDVKVTLVPPEAVVKYDPAKASVQALEQATDKAGFRSSVKRP